MKCSIYLKKKGKNYLEIKIVSLLNMLNGKLKFEKDNIILKFSIIY